MTWRHARMVISALFLLVNGYLIVLWGMLGVHYERVGLQTQLKISRGEPVTEEELDLHDHWRHRGRRRGSYYSLTWEYVSNPTIPPVKTFLPGRPDPYQRFLQARNDSALDWAGTLLWFGAFEVFGFYCTGIWVEWITGRNRRAIDGKRPVSRMPIRLTLAADGKKLMQEIPIRSAKPIAGHDSLAEAIGVARSHPRQAQAKRDTDRLRGETFQNAEWIDEAFVLACSGRKWIHLTIDDDLEVAWSVTTQPPQLPGPQSGSLGDESVLLKTTGSEEGLLMDRSALITQRLGSRIRGLWVTELDLTIYTEGHPMLCFSVAKREDTGGLLLIVSEDD